MEDGRLSCLCPAVALISGPACELWSCSEQYPAHASECACSEGVFPLCHRRQSTNSNWSMIVVMDNADVAHDHTLWWSTLTDKCQLCELSLHKLFLFVSLLTIFFSLLVFRTSMKEKLHQGITLVVDRYAFSGVAFTSAKEVSGECSRPCPSLYLGKEEICRSLVWTSVSVV